MSKNTRPRIAPLGGLGGSNNGAGLGGSKPNNLINQIKDNEEQVSQTATDTKATQVSKAESNSNKDVSVLAKEQETPKVEPKEAETPKVEPKEAEQSDSISSPELSVKEEKENGTNKPSKRGVYRYKSIVKLEGEEANTAHTSVYMDFDVYHNIRAKLSRDKERKISFVMFAELMSLACLHDVIDIEKVTKELHKKGLINIH